MSITLERYGSEEKAQLSDAVKEFFQELEDSIGKPVTIRWMNGRAQPLRDDTEGLIIYDFSCQREGTAPQPLDTIFYGTGSPRKTVSLEVFPYYLPIQEGGENVVKTEGDRSMIGTYAKDAVWISFPLSNIKDKDHLKHILNGVCENASNVEFWIEREEAERQKVREHFIQHMRTALDREIEQEEQNVRTIESQLTQLNQQYIEYYRNMVAAGKKLAYAKGQKKDDHDKMDAQLQELYRNHWVEKIEWNSRENCLEIYTKLIYLHSPDRTERTPLGAMVVQFMQNGAVRVKNLTNMRGSSHHPHIEGGGNPCWGGAQHSVGKLSASGELVGLFEVTMNYIQTYNPEDSLANQAPLWFTENETEYKQDDGSWKTKQQLKDDEVSGETETQEASVTESELTGNAQS